MLKEEIYYNAVHTYDCLYSSKENLQRFIKENSLPCGKRALVRIHTSIHTGAEAALVAREVKELLPNAVIIGCSVSALMFKGDIYERACHIGITVFDHTVARVHAVRAASFEDKTPQQIADDLCQMQKRGGTAPRVVFAFFSDFYPRAYSVLNHYNIKSPRVKVAGGLAGVPADSTDKGFVFTEGGAMENTLLAAALYADEGFWSWSDAFIGHEPIGDAYAVTETDGDRWVSIDGTPAAQWFRSLIGEQSISENNDWNATVATDTLLKFPLIIEGHGGSSRFVQYDGKNDAIRGYFCEINKGDRFRVGYLSPLASAKACRALCMKIEEQPTEAMFVYSCLFRKLYLNRCAEWEMRPFANFGVCVPFMFGEISNIDGNNEYLNGSCSILTLSEHADSCIAIDYAPFDDLSGLRESENGKNVSSYIIKKQNEIMYQKNKILMSQLINSQNMLKEKLYMDEDISLPNIDSFMKDDETSGYDKLCTATVVNGEMYENYYETHMFKRLMRANVELIKNFVAVEYPNACLRFYSYGRHSFLIAAGRGVGEDEFREIMSRVYAACHTPTFSGNVTIVNRFVIIPSDGGALLDKVRAALNATFDSAEHFIVYKGGKAADIERDINMIDTINKAIASKSIVPWFQPIRDNTTGKFAIFEALARLRDGDGRILPPAEFLPTAKKFHLSHQVQTPMFNKVIELRMGFGSHVSINISPADIESEGVLSFIYSRLDELPTARHIIFEVLESESFDDSSKLLEFVRGVRARGCQIAIDDFGAGYSNMRRVVSMAPDYLKIDGDIIKDLRRGTGKEIIVDTAVMLAARMGCPVVAEHVDSEEVQRIIEDKGIRYTQGYLFAKPVPYSKLGPFLSQSQIY